MTAMTLCSQCFTAIDSMVRAALLLDTHVLLWFLTDSPKLGPVSREHILSGASVNYSAASIWELTIKSMLGKIALPQTFDAVLNSSGMEELEISAAHARAIASFPQLVSHDPFDRLLVAQAADAGMTLLTADAVLLALGLGFIADARE